MGKYYFITAAGTGVGKTFITSALTQELRARKKSVVALKPVISGFDPVMSAQSDSGVLLTAQGLSLSAENMDAISPWRFRTPISPDMAAENEGCTIDFDGLIAFCRQERKADYTIVEGVGGVMVPLTPSHTVLDWMAALDHRIILVSGSYLGALSHALTAAHILLARQLPLHCVVVSESEGSAVPPERIQLTLKRFLPKDLSVLLVKRGANAATLADSIT